MTILKRNLIANFAGSGWSALLGLVVLPICLRLMRVEAYGLFGISINAIWNRSKITPMEASVSAKILQVKSRVFEQGLSGTLMVCRQSPGLEAFYEPGTEFVPFDDLDDCVEKAHYYLQHERQRLRIARVYHDRTRAEHMRTHRFQRMSDDIGLGALARRMAKQVGQ